MKRTYSEKPKVQEVRIRARAKRQGLFLSRSRARDPKSLLFGCWWLYELIVSRDLRTKTVSHTILKYGGPGGYPDLDTIEKVLSWDPDIRRSVGHEFRHPWGFEKPDKQYDDIYHKLLELRPN